MLALNSPTHGEYRVRVDAEDAARVAERDWIPAPFPDRRRVVFYTYVDQPDGTRATVTLHRFLMPNCPEYVDHRFHDSFDLRKSELRCATHAENLRNRRKHRAASSKYKGVVWDREHSKWRAHIMADRKVTALGRCPGTPEGERECAERYDRAARELHGEFALTNFHYPNTERETNEQAAHPGA